MKATARAHPIQGLVKYHGLRDETRNRPYHDSISVCTAPASTTTTVEFGYGRDTCLVNGDPVDPEGREKVGRVLDLVRERSGLQTHARVESENTFPSNVGLGASASAFAALALAAADAADLSMSRADLSVLARRGSASAARSVAGGFAHLRTAAAESRCGAVRIADGFEDVRVVVGLVPAHKHTSRAHAETARSHLFPGRLAAVHERVATLRDAIARGDFAATFGGAERDSLALLAVTMTGPEGWVYWQPETLALLRLARRLREENVPVYFSADTGATVYLNTTAPYVDRVVEEVESRGVETNVWRVGGPARLVDDHLF